MPSGFLFRLLCRLGWGPLGWGCAVGLKIEPYYNPTSKELLVHLLYFIILACFNLIVWTWTGGGTPPTAD